MTDDNVHRFPRMSMGDAMTAFGLTARAIRHYEERGLITAMRDRKNNRCFDERARARLGWISALRAADLGLRDIAEVLRAEDRDGRGQACALARLEARRTALTTQIADIDRAVLRLRGSEPGLQPVRGVARA